MDNALTKIQSPCILLCSIDMASGYCFGCGRTGDEIANWMTYSNTERDEIIASLDNRLKNIKRKPRRQTRRTRMARQTGDADHQALIDRENAS